MNTYKITRAYENGQVLVYHQVTLAEAIEHFGWPLKTEGEGWYDTYAEDIPYVVRT